MRPPLSAWRFICVVAIGLVSHGGCAGADADPANATIAITVQPGKPGAPAETIRVTRTAVASSIEVARRSFDGQTQRESRALPPEAFRSLWRYIERDRLLLFKPEPRPGDVFDFGERRLQITASSPTSSDKTEASVNIAWDKPLQNERTIEPFFKAMAAAAEKHCKDVKLHYIK